jgi:hypothetical protein
MRWKLWKREPSLNFARNILRRLSFGLICKRKIKDQKGEVTSLSTFIYIVLGWIGITGEAVAAFAVVAAVVIKAALIVGAVWYSYSASSKAKSRAGQSDRSDFRSSGHLLNTRSTSEPLSILYGTCRIGGNIVYMNCTGADNKDLHMVVTFSEGPVSGINIDGIGERIWLDDKRIQDFPGLYSYEFYTGTGAQTVDPYLQAADPNWDEAMRYTAYLHLRLEYNEDKFSSLPNVTAEINGRLIYDPRDGLTKFSNNNALVAYDFLRNERYSLGLPESVFDLDSVKDAATWCDTNGYMFNGLIIDRGPVLDNFEDILKNFRAGLIWSEGEYKLFIYEYDAPIMTLTESDVDANSFRIIIPGIPETPNRVIVSYIDSVDNYISKSRVIEDLDAVLIYDLEERDFELDLKGTTNAEQATKLGSYYIERNRLNYQFSFSCHPRALALEPMDMIQVTHSLPGWTEKILRVLDYEIRQDGRVQLLCINEVDTLYDDVVNVETHNAYETNLPNPIAVPPNVINVSINEELYGTKNNILTKLLVSFSVPESYKFFNYAEIWTSTDGVNYTLNIARSGTYAEIMNVNEKATCYVKIIPVNFYNVKRALADTAAHDHYVYGKTALPEDIDDFWAIFTSEGVFLNWTEVSDIDLDHYEIRWSSDATATWSTSIPIAAGAKGDKIWLPVAKAGRYLIKAVDTSGNYSSNAATCDLDIAEIITWNSVEQLVEDPGFTGTKTLMTLIADILYLTDGNTTGYYYSATQPDLGYVCTSRCALNLFGYGINDAALWDDITDFDLCGDIDGDVSQISIQPQIALSQDNINWGDWTNFFTGNYVARAYKFRIKVVSTHVDQRYAIENLTFYIDMPDRNEGAKSVTIPNTGDTIEFTKAFQVVPRMWITIQDGAAGDYYDLQSVTVDDFTVQIKNSGGTGIEKDIDWQAGGY